MYNHQLSIEGDFMTLSKKIFTFSTISIFIFLGLFLILNTNSAKKTIHETSLAQVQSDILKFQNIVHSGNMVDIVADGIFQSQLIQSVVIDDFLENKLYSFEQKSSYSLSFVSIFFSVQSEEIKTYTKDATGENISIQITLDDNYINSLVADYFMQSLLYFLISFFLLSGLVFLIVKQALGPLSDIKNQVFHLKENKLMEASHFPKATDLREIVVMLNEISINLKSKFKKDTEMMNKYYEVLYTDEETGLNNRNFFTMHLNSEVDTGKEGDNGLVIFVKIINFDQLNKVYGFKQIHLALQSLTKTLQKLEIPYSVLARVKPDTFAYIISNQKFSESKKIISKHYETLVAAINNGFTGTQATLAMAAGEFQKGDSTKSLLSRIDVALNEATILTTEKKIAYAKTGQRALTKEERINLIEFAFKNDSFNVELRPIQDLKEDRKNFLKLVTFLQDEQSNIYNKNEYLSILYEKNMVAQYDESIINKVSSRYRLINQPIIVMVSISSEFINSLDHIRWLGDKLEELAKNENIKLCFAVKDAVAQNELEELLQFAKLVYRFKHYIAITGFTLDKEKLSYLQRLRPRYIILDQDYIEDLYVEDKSRVKAINFMIHEVSAKTVVSYLSDPKMITMMDELDVDYLLSSNYKGEY